MSRPLKSGVDYFPLNVDMDDKLKLIQAEHKILGFAVVIKVYQKVYANNYWLMWDKKAVLVFSNENNVDINQVNVIINSCFEWGVFCEDLFKEHGILTSRGIQKRFFEITKRRKRVEVTTEYLLVDLPTDTKTEYILVNVDNNSINVCESTQRKGKERKGKERESKKKEKKYTDSFLNLWANYPNPGDAKDRTFKNYNQSKKLFSLTDDQMYKACMNYAEQQKGKGTEPKFMYKLSNLLGQNYRDSLPGYLKIDMIAENFSMELDGTSLAKGNN